MLVPETGNEWRTQSALKAVAGKEIIGPGGKKAVDALFDKASAIVVAHLQGEPADMHGIMRVARKHRIPVVEDCAQSYGAIVKGGNPSYWFLRLRFNADAVCFDKTAFCKALATEGLNVTTAYNHMPHTGDWFKNRHVFGTGKLPWSAPLYKGDASREFDCPNARKAIADHLILTVYESWGKREADDIINIFKKVEALGK